MSHEKHIVSNSAALYKKKRQILKTRSTLLHPLPYFPRGHPKTGFPSPAPGEGHVEQAIEATGTQHGRIDELRTVGRSHDEHISPRLQAVHFRQELVNLRRRVSACVRVEKRARGGGGVGQNIRRRFANSDTV